MLILQQTKPDRKPMKAIWPRTGVKTLAKGIQGITVTIGGDTSPLQKALKDVNKTTHDLQSELQSCKQRLKFDPGNLTLVSQTANTERTIAATEERLKLLKEAGQVNDR